MVALVLELLPKGSLTALLKEKGLVWDDPLLRLVTDCARGMAYLHDREFMDEVSDKLSRCVLHRDLKPDNVLVTNYAGAKLADFGTSRAMDAYATMTAVRKREKRRTRWEQTDERSHAPYGMS
jgi:serine/threonine protein kinase